MLYVHRAVMLFWYRSEISHSHPAPHSDPQRVLLQRELIRMDDYSPITPVYYFGPWLAVI